jgi:small neutral amino acid transporter SnatA (MarC family)
MVFAKLNGTFGGEMGVEPFIVPLAIPLIAGPSALATVMLMASRDPARVGMWAAAITVTMVLTTVVLLAGTKLHRLLGEHAMHAIERLMGLILTAIAVEMLLAGIREFVKGLA